VTHSLLRPHLAASASDDGRAVLWAGAGLAGEVGAARPAGGASVTAVHLSPHDENLLAVGCADSAAYVYDLRRLAAPLEALRGHARPVSYVRFMGRSRLVTASTDASLACWDLAGAGRGGDGDGSGSGSGAGGGSDASDLLGAGGGRRAARRFRGHTNSKNFVGLSVRPEDGLVACGSESSQVFAYSLNWDQPLAAHDFGGGPPAAGAVAAARAGFAPFCTAVCWQAATACPGGEPLLAAATSDGGLRVLALRKRQLREEER
jgi:WD40 repeat protein